MSFYNSSQYADLTNTVFVSHLHASVDYCLIHRIRLGLKLTYSMMNDFGDSGGYSLHPAHARNPGLTNHNMFEGADCTTLTLLVKRLFGY